LWSFNGKDMSGNSAIDRSGSGNNGTLTNGPTRTIGKVGQALSFDGANDSVLLSSSRNLPSTADWTVSSWVKTVFAGPETVLSNSNGGPVYNLLGIGTSKIWYHHYNGGWLSQYGTSNIADDAWHFLTWVNHSNNTMDLYVDGVAEVVSASSTLEGSGLVNQIGKGWDGVYAMNGKIDEVRIYNRALSASEVLNLYNLGK
jgi:hypothetical protein